jgi:dephospho-CoA kinase
MEFMIVIGIVGGVGSGKSSVARELAELGAMTLDVDQVGHDVLNEIEIKNRLAERWGTGVTDSSGEIDRSVVAGIVFADSPEAAGELKFLESVVHPRITDQLVSRIAEFKQSEKTGVFVVDAAVMVKAGWDRLCDRLVFVEVPEGDRLMRCQQRGWTSEEFYRRELNQQSLELKRERADWVIDNSGSPQELKEQVTGIWNHVHENEA